MLGRAKRSAGIPESVLTQAAELGPGSIGRRPRPRLTRDEILVRLVAAVLVLAGGVAWHHSQTLADEAAAQRAIASAPKPVHGAFSGAEVESLANKITPSLVDVETDLGGAGTGIVLTESGEVLTNNHVINGARSVEVITKSNQKRYSAVVIGYDRDHDVALLQIQNPGKLTPAVVGDSTGLRPGEPILGIGNAGGAGGRPVQAPGNVKDLGRSISTSDELTGSTEQLKGLIRVNADIRSGDSGGPLLNEAGQVIGVNTAATVNYLSSVPNGSGGTGYAIPSNDAMGIVATIRAGRSTDEVHVGPTGIVGVEVSGPAGGPDSRISPGGKLGAKVTEVAEASPAESAGLRQGDDIIGIDGTLVDTPTRLTAITGRHAPGDRLNFEWITPSGQHRSGVVTVIEGPPA